MQLLLQPLSSCIIVCGIAALHGEEFGRHM